MKNNNFILRSDGYKYTHFKQYPPQTTEVYSYFESRGGKYDKTVFFGLQYYIKEYLVGVRLTHEDIDNTKKLISTYLSTPDNFNEAGWRYIVDKHDGKLPIEIKAVPEGSIVPTSNVLFTVRNTDSECFWLTNFIETLLSKVWYTTTIATNSYYIKETIKKYLRETGCNDIDTIANFKLHDFGYRGVATEEQAALGGAAHLLSFMGTDTVLALQFIMDYYNTDEVMGFSIPASEHSTITSWGKDRELDAYRNMLEQYPSGLVACVSDSYNIYNACENLWGEELKSEILNRDGQLICRPDSGVPTKVLPRMLSILGDKFGYTINDKGYKVLNDKVRVIQGDGIDADSIIDILDCLCNEHGWAAENITFGSGGGLLQKFDRDTQKFAVKCSYTKNVFGEIDVYKDPVTDPGKTSKKGKLKLVKVGHHDYVTNSVDFGGKDELRTVFLNGKLITEYTFEEIKHNMEV